MKSIEAYAIELVGAKNKVSELAMNRRNIVCEVESKNFVEHGMEIPGEPPCRRDPKTKDDQRTWCDGCRANLENYRQWKKQKQKAYRCFRALKQAVEQQQKANQP